MNPTSEEKVNNFIIGLFQVKTLMYILYICLAVAITGYFIIDKHWVTFITGHLGGIGILGLLAILSAYIAKRKEYSATKIFNIAFFLPIILGILSVVILSLRTGIIYCGGSICLIVSLLIIVVTSALKTKQRIL